MKFNNRGDDNSVYRLLSLLQTRLPYQVKELKRIRKQVYLVITDYNWLILKEFPSYKKLKIQEAFTNSLHYEGFQATYRFFSFDQDPIIIDNRIYGCIEYIPGSLKPFSYGEKESRQAALALLEQYYECTEKLVDAYRYVLPHFNIYEKWTERSKQFKANLPVAAPFIKKELLQELTSWIDWTLYQLEKEKANLANEKKVILHGDVAHHNFIRGINGHLYLIDFDLISIGPRSMDYLQFANRILPIIGWSHSQLQKMNLLQPFLHERSFLIGLAFPTDILREWNRLIRQNKMENDLAREHVVELTEQQFSKRRKFVYKMMKLTD
ncbi:aminoglycoside phosphotransferase [Niallia circulans]|uniref:Aminoglycoside phosphotransferase n=1 Tax=Niallia circulans TaxID=1397 RepID=A0A553SKB1_NIACI|nr:phosphotransferase [Niallia circulans]TRZ37441.1 aminoglycoside phosphotransferase [Niallia circulans]